MRNTYSIRLYLSVYKHVSLNMHGKYMGAQKRVPNI